MLSCVKEGQRLYLTAWNFNTCRVLGCLADIVENNGGKVAPFRRVMANNRQYEPDAEPISIYGQGYIRFNLDGVQYYWQIDDNPFFEHYYTKVRIADGKVPRGNQVYLDEFSRKEWMYDCLFKTASDADIHEIANLALNALINAPFSKVEPERETRRVRVPYVEVVEEKPMVYVDADLGVK